MAATALQFRESEDRKKEHSVIRKGNVGKLLHRLLMGEMQIKGDGQLLREYVDNGAESSFAEIVTRHTSLVYTAALRQVASPDIAADVTQTAFLALARSAPALHPTVADNASLAGWLCRSARNISLNIRRNDFRRQSRERDAMEFLKPVPETVFDWDRLRPVLDEAMSELKEPDHDALVLRYFKNHDFREVGRALGVSDDAAQKRVGRALEKLRHVLERHGISTSTGALALTLSANAVQAAPIALATTISAATAVSTGTVITATKIIAMSTLQKTLVGATLVAAIGTGIYGVRHLSTTDKGLRTEQPSQAERPATEAKPNGKQPSDQLESTQPNVELTNQQALASLPSSTNQEVLANENSLETDTTLPRESWADVGFSTPAKALQTRGWTVSSGNRQRFKDSVYVTDSARQTMEDMFIKMMEASTDPNKAQFIQQVLNDDFDVEDGILMPMMAENRQKGYTGYRILSQQSPAADEAIIQLEILMTSAPARKETLKLRRIGNDWRVVIDDEFIKKQQR